MRRGSNWLTEEQSNDPNFVPACLLPAPCTAANAAFANLERIASADEPTPSRELLHAIWTYSRAEAAKCPSVVYAVRVPNGPIKIGVTQGFASRLKDLQTFCPYPLATLATAPGSYRFESLLHRILRRDRLRGEWFTATPFVLSVVHELALASRKVEP